MRLLIRIVIIVLTLLILAYLGICLYIASEMTKPVARTLEIEAKTISSNFENVSFTDQDNLVLRGWYFPGQNGKAVLLVSGILNNRVNAGYLAPEIAKELLAEGYAVLMYDHRATGTSDGTRVSYGQHEAGGVLSAVRFLEGKGFSPNQIGILADSMGTAAVLETFENLSTVGPIVLDSPPADIAKAASHILATERGVPTFLHPTIYFFTKYLFGADLNSVKPNQKILLAPERKFLFLHGGMDISVLPANSEELWSLASQGSKLVIFPKGKHIETFKSDPALYRTEVYSFLKEEFR